MQDQLKQKLVIDVTYTFDSTGTKATLNRVLNALLEDITNDFRLFAHQRSLPLSTQNEIEQVSREYIESRKNNLP